MRPRGSPRTRARGGLARLATVHRVSCPPLGVRRAAEGSISVPGIAWKDMAASGDLQDALEDALTFVLSLDGTVPRDSLAELADLSEFLQIADRAPNQLL